MFCCYAEDILKYSAQWLPQIPYPERDLHGGKQHYMTVHIPVAITQIVEAITFVECNFAVLWKHNHFGFSVSWREVKGSRPARKADNLIVISDPIV
jgi:hypothetical protein